MVIADTVLVAHLHKPKLRESKAQQLVSDHLEGMQLGDGHTSSRV